MAEKSGFFDAHASVDADGHVVYDRTYLAESFAKYFASFIGNGVFGGKSNELMVRQRSIADMSVVAHSGQGWINGYWYENDDELSLAIDVADGILNRIDTVVLRWDISERGMRIHIKKGTPASSPLAPVIQRDADIYELKLAEVYVKAGATKITQVDITDTRLDSDVCGFVVGIVEQFDTAEFNAQLNAWIETFKLESIEEVNNLLEQVKAILQASDLGPLIVDIQNLKDNTVKKNGDTMTDNLEISKQSAPTLILDEESTGSRAHFQLWNGLLFIANRTVEDDSYYRSFYISNHREQDDVAHALKLLDVRDSVSKVYTIMHTGNASEFGIGVVPASVE